ncbi:hypothetical protein CH305_18485 [Rhodococcus sp. 15-649-2-2]|uniref:hypothetical protein n=1 Tax=Rhodococcus sp. 15-649-2-2 TaxID=2023140 RepID=UPI000B9ADD8F|nr:hypothetical protein [Rhodococcus sp. 15-649-2-2]OZE77224.1 hypothetical protein CH305_18485 [Rhodococcus sp. 15-649-2-2]
MTTSTPYVPGAIRQFLRSIDEYTTLCPADGIVTGDLPPGDITAPFATITAPSNYGVDPMLRRPLIQIDVWVPRWEILGGDVEPEELAWNIGDLGARLIHKARQQKFRNCTWNAEWIDGPITEVDRQRGVDLPLFRSITRFDVKVVVR